PFTIVVILTKFFGKNKSFKEALPLLPWTLLIGVVYTLSALLYAWLFGPEFISLLGAMTGLIVATITARLGFLMPKGEAWQGALREGFKLNEEKSNMSLLTAWSPYIVV